MAAASKQATPHERDSRHLHVIFSGDPAYLGIILLGTLILLGVLTPADAPVLSAFEPHW